MLIPFVKEGSKYIKTGSLVEYDHGSNIEWKENFIFEDTLTYDSYSRGRSSIKIDFIDSQGRNYAMFISDFDDLIKTKGLNGDSVCGTWTFCKKGQNYGIKLCNK